MTSAFQAGTLTPQRKQRQDPRVTQQQRQGSGRMRALSDEGPCGGDIGSTLMFQFNTPSSTSMQSPSSENSNRLATLLMGQKLCIVLPKAPAKIGVRGRGAGGGGGAMTQRSYTHVHHIVPIPPLMFFCMPLCSHLSDWTCNNQLIFIRLRVCV